MPETINTFLTLCGVNHVFTPQLWPRSNGEVERQNRTLLKALRIAHLEGRNWKDELHTFLLAYRTTPHTTTGVSPSEAFLQRAVRWKLPSVLSYDISDDEMRCRDQRLKAVGNTARERNVHKDSIRVGDRVLVRQFKGNKFTAAYDPDPYTVIEMAGCVVTIEREGRTLKRHISHIRLLFHDHEAPADEPTLQASSTAPETTMEVNYQRRSSRQKQVPAHLKDYVVETLV